MNFCLAPPYHDQKNKEENETMNLNGLDMLMRFLPVLLPIIVLELGLMIGALVHLLKRKRVKRGSVALWVVIIVLVNLIGPILYFTIGREDS
jgi:hypothetical protein